MPEIQLCGITYEKKESKSQEQRLPMKQLLNSVTEKQDVRESRDLSFFPLLVNKR